MKKRILFLFGTIVASLFCALGFAACGKKTPTEHVHSWGEWVVETEATCTERGVRSRVCSECDEKESEPIAMVDHTYTTGWEVVEEPTCTKVGKEQNVCSFCHQGQEREIPMKDHTFGPWYTVKDATCSAEGLQRRDCIVCNAEAVEDGAHETKSLEQLQHVPKAVEEVPANCLDAGREAGHVCDICGAVLDGMEEILPLGHDMGPYEKVKDSTCTDPGVERSTCQRAGCVHSDEKPLPLADHVHVPYGEDRDPTCEDDGTIAGDWCEVCHTVFKDIQKINKLNHDFSGDPVPVDLTDKGDGAEYWHRYTCTRLGCNTTLLEECKFELEATPATCTEAEHHVHTCSVCSFKREHDEGRPLGHNYTGWVFDEEAFLGQVEGIEEGTRRHVRTCLNAGHTEDPDDPDTVECTPVVQNTVKETCTTAGYTVYRCKDCQNEYTADPVDATGHTWGEGYQNREVDGVWMHFKICSTCEEEGQFAACVCPNPDSHIATCTEAASIDYTCADCGHSYTVVKGEALGHSYSRNAKHDDTTTAENSRHYFECQRCGDKQYSDCNMVTSSKQATCQDPGVEVQMCSVCQYTESEYLEMVQHKFVVYEPNANGTHTRHSLKCTVCNRVVFEDCSFAPTIVQALSCQENERTQYECSVCHDKYTMTTALKTGHVFENFVSVDRENHEATCRYCGERLKVKHDFTETNICSSCHTDGLTYSYVTGSTTQAKVSRTFIGGRAVVIDAPRIEVAEMVDLGNGLVPVVSIGLNAFFQNTKVQEVVIPASVETIEYNAFDGCTSLRNVRIAGHNFGDTNVTDSKLTKICSDAFRGCTALEQAILPASLVSIGQRAFKDCKTLAEINLPETITDIGDYAFEGTAYYNNTKNWEPDGVLYIGHHLIRARTDLTGAYTVETGTVSIGSDAFKGCSALKSITLPAELLSSASNAFDGCTGLETVIFEGNIEQFLGIRFANDKASPMHYAANLTIKGATGELTIPEGTSVIPAGTFRGSSIRSIYIPWTVTSIGSMAFADCPYLESIVFQTGSELYTLGSDVVKNTPFYDNPDNWTDGVLYIRDEDEGAIALVAVDPDRIPQGNYTNLDGETGSYRMIEVEEGTTAIAPRAFANIKDLRLVIIPDSVYFLGEGIFEGCSSLNRVDFRGTKYGWFCNSPTIARSYSDASIYGGADHDDYSRQRSAANMFKLYTLSWKRGNYGG